MKSITKALTILEAFLVQDEGMSLSNIAKLTGVSQATASRIVSILVERGYLYRPERRGNISLGTKFLDFSGIIKKKLKIGTIALPHLIKLNNLVEETIILATMDYGRIIYNELIHCKNPLRIVPDETIDVPLYCTGIGKIFLAYMTEAELQSYFDSNVLKPFTANTITHPDLLRSHLLTIAKEGISFDDEEHHVGIRNVAAAIRNGEGRVVASVGVLGPSIRLTRARITEILPYIKDCASSISQALGYKGV